MLHSWMFRQPVLLELSASLIADWICPSIYQKFDTHLNTHTCMDFNMNFVVLNWFVLDVQLLFLEWRLTANKCLSLTDGWEVPVSVPASAQSKSWSLQAWSWVSRLSSALFRDRLFTLDLVGLEAFYHRACYYSQSLERKIYPIIPTGSAYIPLRRSPMTDVVCRS